MKIIKQEQLYLTSEEYEILMQAKRICYDIYRETKVDEQIETNSDKACDGLGYLLDIAEVIK